MLQCSYDATTCTVHIIYRYGFRQLLEGNCADIIQPDITWLGGITEVSLADDVACF